MQTTLNNGITLTYPDNMDSTEAILYLQDVPAFQNNSSPLIALNLTLNPDNTVKLNPHYNTIVRLRRITGYMSNIKNFNDAKQAELYDRYKHIKET